MRSTFHLLIYSLGHFLHSLIHLYTLFRHLFFESFRTKKYLIINKIIYLIMKINSYKILIKNMMGLVSISFCAGVFGLGLHGACSH